MESSVVLSSDFADGLILAFVRFLVGAAGNVDAAHPGLGIVGGAEFGASVSYGWYVDYDMKEE